MKLSKNLWRRCAVNIKKTCPDREIRSCIECKFFFNPSPFASTTYISCRTLFDIIIHKYVFNTLNGNWFDENVKEKKKKKIEAGVHACIHFQYLKGDEIWKPILRVSTFSTWHRTEKISSKSNFHITRNIFRRLDSQYVLAVWRWRFIFLFIAIVLFFFLSLFSNIHKCVCIIIQVVEMELLAVKAVENFPHSVHLLWGEKKCKSFCQFMTINGCALYKYSNL